LALVIFAIVAIIILKVLRDLYDPINVEPKSNNQP
jgi:hypothetical protein